MLDRIESTAERRDPVIADLARQLRNRYYDQPLVAERRAGAYADVEEHLRALSSGIATATWRRSSPHGHLLAPLLIGHMTEAPPERRPILLELMTRRYYRTRDLAPSARRSSGTWRSRSPSTRRTAAAAS